MVALADHLYVSFSVSAVCAAASADIMCVWAHRSRHPHPSLSLSLRHYPTFAIALYNLFSLFYLPQGLGSLLYRLMLSHLYSPDVLAEAEKARRRKKVDDARDNGLLVHRETQVSEGPHQ